MSNSGDPVGSYVRALYRSDEHVALLAVERLQDRGVKQRIVTADALPGASYQRWLRHLNANGWDLFVSMNPINPSRGQREKRDVAAVRRLQLDLDNDGAESLAHVLQDVGTGRLPQPGAVVRSSTSRYQVLWHTGPGWDVEAAEDTMTRLAALYGGDPAVADVARVMRLPGFRNKKPGRDDALVTWTDYAGRPVAPEDFAALPARPDVSSPVAAAGAREAPEPSAPGGISQSERDWAFVRSQLRKGTDQETLVAEIAERRRGEKYRPDDYARRTVQKAAESLRHLTPRR